jgi:hypothetical protein
MIIGHKWITSHGPLAKVWPGPRGLAPRQASAYAEPEPQQQLPLLRRGRRTSIPDRMTLGEMAAFAGTVVALALVFGFL